MTLRISTTAIEGVYQGSKFLKQQVLCDQEELSALFKELDPFWIFPLTGLVSGEAMSTEYFLLEYGSWIDRLQKGEVPTDSELRRILACAFTVEKEALWKQEMPGWRYLNKVCKPVVQVQAHLFTYSPVDEIFRPMTMGGGSIFWGLQFSFPQIYQDPKTMELLEIDESENGKMFQKIRQWVRNTTRPTPFVVNGKQTNSPIRLGKNCFRWIDKHPQLSLQKIGVYAG